MQRRVVVDDAAICACNAFLEQMVPSTCAIPLEVSAGLDPDRQASGSELICARDAMLLANREVYSDARPRLKRVERFQCSLAVGAPRGFRKQTQFDSYEIDM